MANRNAEYLTVVLAAAAIVGSSCAPSLRPDAAAPPDYAPRSATKCKIKASQSKPLVVEWRAEDRGELESRAKRSLVVVRYDGCEMEILPRCDAGGGYRYVAMSPKRTTETIRNEDELYAAVPMGAAKLEGKLAAYGELQVRMTMVGRWESTRNDVKTPELSGECRGASHVVHALTVGAFTFVAGSGSEQGASAGVAGIGAGAASKRTYEELTQDGDPTRCEQATDQDKNPVPNCAAVIRLEVQPIVSAPCPAGQLLEHGTCVPARGQAKQDCPAGTSWNGTTCAPAAANAPCKGGTHYVEGKGCVPDSPAATGSGPALERVEAAVKRLRDRGVVQVSMRHGKLIISGPVDFFDSGKADLRSAAKDWLREVADSIAADRTLAELSYQVLSHTGTTPLRGSQYRDNWELSAQRARAVQVFLSTPKGAGCGLDARRWSSAGMGDSDPVDAGEGARNERVEIVVQIPLVAPDQ